ncbi:MAG: pitrilysin family protein [Bacteroidota bacterium]
MKKLILISAAILLSLSVNAQVDRSKIPVAGPAPLIQLGKYESFILPNGLKVFVVENHKLPKVSYSLVLDYDPIFEGEKAGYVQCAGTMLGTATTSRTKEQIDEQTDFMGASLEFSSGGFFGSCLKKHNEKLLELMSDIILNAQFKQDELDKVRTQLKSGLASEKNDPDAMAQRVGGTILYGKDHPYGENITDKSLDNVKLEDCKAFFSTYFKPNVGYLAVVGDITMAEVRPLIEKYFSAWQQGTVPTLSYKAPAAPSKPVVCIVDKPGAPQSVVNLMYPVDFKPNNPDAIKMKVMNTALGGGTFRLFNNLREKHSFTYGCYSQLQPDELAARFNASASVRTSVTDSAFTEILYEMNRLRNEAMPQAELDMVKNYLSGTFALSLERPQTIANFAINTERYNLPKDYYANYLKNLAAVSIQDVQAMAQKYLLTGNSYIFAVGNAAEITETLKKFSPDGKIVFYDKEANVYDPTQTLKPAPAGMTADQVVGNYIKAIGGDKNLMKIKDITTKMSTSMQGQTLTFTSYRKAPNKSKTEIAMGPMVVQTIVFDGVKCMSMSAMEGSKELKDKELEDMKYQSIMHLELYYAKYAVKSELMGVEKVNDKDAYKVDVTMPNGTKTTDYFDVATGLKVRSIEGEGSQTELSDYREVNGVKFPHKIVQSAGPQTFELKVDLIEINKKLKDSFFSTEVKK